MIGPNNQVLNDGTYSYAYDAEGNLSLKTEIATGKKFTYTWDYRNRLIEVKEFHTIPYATTRSTRW